MSLTILSARWSNPDHEAAILTTKETGDVLATVDHGEEWVTLQDWIKTSSEPAAYEAAPPPPAVVSKVDLFRRMTAAEVDTLLAVKATRPRRDQALFDSAPQFHETAPEWPMLKALFEASYGPDRAAELLAPST